MERHPHPPARCECRLPLGAAAHRARSIDTQLAMTATVLLTGATGYIASHTWLALLQAGFRVVGVDNFANSSPRVVERLRELAGTALEFERADVCDAGAMASVIQRHRIDAAIHFAAFKSVGESTSNPLAYYANNLGGLVTLCAALQERAVGRFVFSSSATVYGQPERLPIDEDAALSATNPYGQTKLIGEQILRDLGAADPRWRTACLRYFNPVGAHASGRIGEDPRGTPNNLMPYVAQVAVGRRPALSVFGDDYRQPTAPACATTSTSATSPAATWRRCGACSTREARSPSTSAPVAATACSRWSRLHAASGRSVPHQSCRAVRATWRAAMPTRRWRSGCSGGRRHAGYPRCAPMRGGGRAAIRRGMCEGVSAVV